MEKKTINSLNEEKTKAEQKIERKTETKTETNAEIKVVQNAEQKKEKRAEKKSEKKSETKTKTEIFLDDNLMIKKDFSDIFEEESESEEGYANEYKKSKAAYKEIENEEKSAVLSKVENLLERISSWSAEKYEQFRNILKEPDNELELYKYRKRKERLTRVLKIAGVSFLVLFLVFTVKYLIEYHSYDSYSVVSKSEKVDTGISHFVELDGKLLHYSADGVALTSTTDELIWSDSYQMSQPMVERFQSVVVIYDLKGTQIHVYNNKGKLGSFQTDYPIMKASVSAKGEVAVILENGETTLINYYTETGGLIASSSTNMRNPGYPVDLAVSKDGLSVVVTYFVTDEDTISSYIAFYDFGDVGRKKEDNLIGGVRCAGVLVPEVQYLDNDRVIAYTEEGFKIFKVKSEPEEMKEVIFEDDIVSSFSDGKHIGFVFKNNNLEAPFRMKLFDTAGDLVMETEFDILYDDIKISDDRIILNNESQMEIYSLKGIEKYSGTIEEGNIHEVVKVGMNKYIIVYNGGVVTIKLK